MYVMCVVLWSASVGYVDCKNMHSMKNIKHAGMQLGCQSSIQEVADSECGRCSTHITILFRKLSFNLPFVYVRIQPAAQQTPILCSQLLCFPRLYALFVCSQIMHITTTYIFLGFTHLTMFFLFIFLVSTIEFTWIYTSYFSSQSPLSSKVELVTPQYNLPKLNRYQFSIHWSQLMAINCTRKYHCAYLVLTCLSVLQSKLYCGLSINSHKMVKYV